MKIVFRKEVMDRIMEIANATNLEFSGYGYAYAERDVIAVYDFVLLDIGTVATTEIPAELRLPLVQRPDAKYMKVWIHRHPVGTGIPGPENWSSTDNYSCVKTPLGATPEIVRWSAACVLTPYGWVGRVDNHVKGQTIHVPVEPNPKAIHKKSQIIVSERQTNSRFTDEFCGLGELYGGTLRYWSALMATDIEEICSSADIPKIPDKKIFKITKSLECLMEHIENAVGKLEE